MKSFFACGTFLLVLFVAAMMAFASPVLAEDDLSTFDEQHWWDPSVDLTLNVRLPARSVRSFAPNTTNYNATDFFATERALRWCRRQGGQVSWRQYGYAKGGGVVAFGKKRAFCDLGQYTITEVETLSSPYLTLAQMAYVHPHLHFKWNRTRWGNPSTQYCYEMGGTSLSSMYVPELGTCTNTGWTTLPVEDSYGLSNTCEFADGSSIDAWALFNGQPISTAKRLNEYFYLQVEGKRCQSPP